MMNRFWHVLASIGIAFSACISLALSQPSRLAAPTSRAREPLRPNFIFILGEGQGWSSTSVAMDDRAPGARKADGLTPNLERLGGEGMRFSDFYATCPRCTPSRASFFTGISPAKLHMTYVNESGNQRDGKNGPGGRRAGGRPDPGRADDQGPLLTRMIAPQPDIELPAGAGTTGEVLRGAGYATAHFGKWHVGRVSPSRHGFDETDGANNNQGPGNDGKPNPGESAAITDRGLAFMEAQVKAGKPFFMQLSHYSAANEDEVTPESLAETGALMPGLKGKALASAAGMRDLDKAVGRVMRRVAELGIADRTFVFFSTDHGSPGGDRRSGGEMNAPLRRGKGSVQEGGVRVPFIVQGPGIRAGTFSRVRATGMDLLPTLADLAGSPIAVDPKARDDVFSIEGGSLVPVLLGGGRGVVKRAREEIVIHFPHYDLNNGGPASAIYLDDFKLLRIDETGRRMLFDLSKDREEREDLAPAMPAKVKELEARLDSYLDAVHAQRASANPAYKDGNPAPSPTPPPARKSPGGKGGG